LLAICVFEQGVFSVPSAVMRIKIKCTRDIGPKDSQINAALIFICNPRATISGRIIPELTSTLRSLHARLRWDHGDWRVATEAMVVMATAMLAMS